MVMSKTKRKNHRRLLLHRRRRLLNVALNWMKILSACAPKKDVRLLELWLVQAERSWVRAGELRALFEENESDHKRKRHNARACLKKSTVYARELVRFAKGMEADERTQLEAEAYACHLEGLVGMELGEWASAHSQLSTTLHIVETLKKNWRSQLCGAGRAHPS